MSDPSAVFELVRKYGRTTTSLQILASNFRYWHGEDACVAYAEVGGSWVASGSAIAAEDSEVEAMAAFAKEAERQGKRARFFCVERALSSDSPFASMHIGDQPVWDPNEWPKSLGKSLREQLRRARAKKVAVRLASPEEIADVHHPTRRGVNGVIAHWLENRRIARMGFVIDLDPFHQVQERRVFVAEQAGQVVGVMIAIPIYGTKGWLIDNMLRDPSAPNGTVELLFDLAMRTFAAEGCSYVTLGLSPFVGVSSPLIKVIRDCTGYFYNFKGLYAFKTKLRPLRWQPIYLAYPKRERGISAVLDSITAFLPGGWIPFIGNTLIQRAALAAGVGAGLLLPWMVLLALADTAHWFPSRAVQFGWVACDLVMFAGLATLARRWRRWLAVGLGALCATNVALSMVQLVSYNAARASGSDWLPLSLGIAGPLLTAIFLWVSRDRAQLHQPAPALQPAPKKAALPAALEASSRPARNSARAKEPIRVSAPIPNREL